MTTFGVEALIDLQKRVDEMLVKRRHQRLSASACDRACARDVRERDALDRAGTDAKFSRRFAHRQAAPASLTDSFL